MWTLVVILQMCLRFLHITLSSPLAWKCSYLNDNGLPCRQLCKHFLVDCNDLIIFMFSFVVYYVNSGNTIYVIYDSN